MALCGDRLDHLKIPEVNRVVARDQRLLARIVRAEGQKRLAFVIVAEHAFAAQCKAHGGRSACVAELCGWRRLSCTRRCRECCPPKYSGMRSVHQIERHVWLAPPSNVAQSSKNGATGRNRSPSRNWMAFGR